MQFLGAVDGTGPYSNAEYQRSFKDSFVLRIKNTFSWGDCLYVRGPGLDGFSTDERGEEVAERIRKQYRFSKGNGQFFLTGYSRGGAAVIHAAHLLAKDAIPIKAMFLFDAVDRTISTMKTTIPENVRVCYHALKDNRTRSRSLFGHCGLQYNPDKTTYRKRSFVGTHGALGGLPQTTPNAFGTVSDEEPIPMDSKVSFALNVGKAAGPTAGVAALATAQLADMALRAITSTTVTPERNKATSEAVWKWMIQYVRTERSSG